MRMTREQVADLLLKMNDDFSNVERYYDIDGKCYPTIHTELKDLVAEISAGAIYRIKDNAVKEVTPALRGKWAINKINKIEHLIIGLCYDMQRIAIGGGWFKLEEFNNVWQLVED